MQLVMLELYVCATCETSTALLCKKELKCFSLLLLMFNPFKGRWKYIHHQMHYFCVLSSQIMQNDKSFDAVRNLRGRIIFGKMR